MPTLTFRKDDLFEIIGKKIEDEELEEIINSFKPEVEEISEEEIKIEFTPDRADLFSVEGLGNAIRMFLGIGRYVEPKLRSPKIRIKVTNVPKRPWIAAAVVRNVKMSDSFIRSLMNVQEVLHQTLGRNRKKVAIGIHDLDKIKGRIIYKLVSPEEKMTPLGYEKEMTLNEILKTTEKGKEYSFILEGWKNYPVYMDRKGIFSFPPILNSQRTRVTESTKNIFVEVTGTDKRAVLQVLNLLVYFFSIRGFKIEKVKIYGAYNLITPRYEKKKYVLTPKEIYKILGVKLKTKEASSLLKRMGFECKTRKNSIEVKVPFYRVDILHKIDVIEDVAIAYGYNNFSPELPSLFTKGSLNLVEEISSKVREIAIGLGFQEVMRFVLSNPQKLFDRMRLKREKVVEIENPVSSEYTCMRNWLLPSLMEVLSKNTHEEFPQKIFEVGDVVLIDPEEETQTKTVRKFALVSSHSKANFAEIRSIVDAIFSYFGVNYSVENASHNSFVEGRVGKILVEGKPVGIFGEVHPEVLKNWNLEMPTVALEISLDFLLESKK